MRPGRTPTAGPGGRFSLFDTGDQWRSAHYAVGDAVCEASTGPCARRFVYACMAWICVLSPSAATFETVKTLLAGAYVLAVGRYGKLPADE